MTVTATAPSKATTITTVTITVTEPNAPPVVSGPGAVAYTEGGRGVVARYTALDPEGEALTWMLAGPDSSAFAIDADGALTFQTPPIHAAPTDANGDNVYQVNVRAFDGTHIGTRDVHHHRHRTD